MTHSIEDMEPEEATSCRQAGTSVDQQGHQPTHKPFDPKFMLSARNAGTEYGAETEGMANQLRPIPWASTSP